MRWTPPGYGGERRPPEEIKRDGWREQGLLAVSVDDQRLTWPEREFVKQLGESSTRQATTAGGRAWIIEPSRWSGAPCRGRGGDPAAAALRVPDYFNTWPPMVVEFADRVGQEPEPTAAAAVAGGHQPDGGDAELAALARSGRAPRARPGSKICWRFGLARATAHRHWRYALNLIAYRLNAGRLIAKRSRLASVMVDEL